MVRLVPPGEKARVPSFARSAGGTTITRFSPLSPVCRRAIIEREATDGITIPKGSKPGRKKCGTGMPIVDAGMRQLVREGYMHNRARFITASFLTKDLYIDWRLGTRHFWDLLVDGDIANNSGNWQWVAGTGNDTRPNRIFNPIRQAHRFDPNGDYVRRYVAELEGIEGPARSRAIKARRLDTGMASITRSQSSTTPRPCSGSGLTEDEFVSCCFSCTAVRW